MRNVSDSPKSDGSTESQVQRLLSKLPAVLTTAPVQAGNFTGVCPEWGTTHDVRRIFGIKRGTLYNLHCDRKVSGKVLRSRGKVKGVRLWDMQSIRDFILSQPDSLDNDRNDRNDGNDGDNDRTLSA